MRSHKQLLMQLAERMKYSRVSTYYTLDLQGIQSEHESARRLDFKGTRKDLHDMRHLLNRPRPAGSRVQD